MKHNSYTNDLLIRAARGERTERTPIWLMRQAGRTDPEYLALRLQCGLPLHELFKHPDLAAEISLLPKRIGVDAIIYFQDILTPLTPMGAEFKFGPGPAISNAVRTVEQVNALREYDVSQELPFIEGIFERVHTALRSELPVLGFAGAPFTLAVFLVEGKSFGEKAEATFAFLREQPEAFRQMLEKITRVTIDYLRYQIACGAAAVQLFESAAYLLNEEMYREWALPYQQEILDALRGTAPTIMFARDWADADSLAAAGADIVSLSDRITIGEYRSHFGKDALVQGNLDNKLLAYGDTATIEKEAISCLTQGNHQGHIFNLGHGLLSETPFERVVDLVNLVRTTRIDR
ncbi:MAG: uroporphyrinogen decarboxylase [Candidatus Hydrogenedentota bacterium]